MSHTKYLYSFKYDYHHEELCRLESRQIFNQEIKNKLIFTDILVDPSISPFMKERFEIILTAENYKELLEKIENQEIHAEGFKAEYVVLEGDDTEYRKRLEKLKNVGYRIEGEPDYYDPSIIYSICQFQDIWYFGVMIKPDNGWFKHKNKPHSFSNSLDMKIAKTLVSISSKGIKSTKLLDACCGVGTVMLESCFAGISIDGCDISLRAGKYSVLNLAHYGYTATVYGMDVQDLNKNYDAAIIDLPYNLYSYSNESITENIIESTAKLASRIVIVSMSDIEEVIRNSKLKVVDYCNVEKRGGSTFSRKVWVCEKDETQI